MKRSTDSSILACLAALKASSAFCFVLLSALPGEANQPPKKTDPKSVPENLIVPARPGHYDEIFREIEMADGRREKILRPEYKDVVDVASRSISKSGWSLGLISEVVRSGSFLRTFMPVVGAQRFRKPGSFRKRY